MRIIAVTSLIALADLSDFGRLLVIRSAFACFLVAGRLCQGRTAKKKRGLSETSPKAILYPCPQLTAAFYLFCIVCLTIVLLKTVSFTDILTTMAT